MMDFIVKHNLEHLNILEIEFHDFFFLISYTVQSKGLQIDNFDV